MTQHFKKRFNRLLTCIFMCSLFVFIATPSFAAPYVNTQISDDVYLSSQHPSCARGVNGELYVVYAERIRQMNPEIIFFNRSVDHGETWLSDSIVVHTQNMACTTPDIAVLDTGELAVVWREVDSESLSEVWFSLSSDGGETWTPAICIHDPTDTREFVLPSITTVNGTIHVSTIVSAGGSLGIPHHSRSDDMGITWSTLTPVCDETCFVYLMPCHMAFNPANSLLCMMINTTNYEVVSCFSDDMGDSWSSPVGISDPTFAVAFDADVAVWNGQFNFVWCARQTMDMSSDVFFNKSIDGQIVSDAVCVTDEEYVQYATRITVDNSGGIHLYWNWQPGGIFDPDFNIYYTCSHDAGVSWEEPVRVNEVENLASAGQYSWAGDIVCDSDGHACLFWVDRRDYPIDFYNDVYFASTRFVNGPTPTPHPTVTPSITPTPTESPTPAPTSSNPGVTLQLSQTRFEPADHFLLEAVITNPGPETYGVCPFVVLLDIRGDFFWYPDWGTEFQAEELDIGIGSQRMEILSFIWPDIPAANDFAWFHGALLTRDYQAILGDFDSVVFQY